MHKPIYNFHVAKLQLIFNYEAWILKNFNKKVRRPSEMKIALCVILTSRKVSDS